MTPQCECCEEVPAVSKVTICDLKDVVLESFFLCVSCLEYGVGLQIAGGTLKHLGKED